MSTRYSTTVDRLRSPQETAQRYHRVLGSVARAQRSQGIFKECVANSIIVAGPPEIEDWHAWENHYKHDTAGFVQAQRELIRDPRHRSLVYLGMTSSNLIDCSDALAWQEVKSRLVELVEEISGLSPWDSRIRMGRTHGRAAEPVRIGSIYDRMIRDLNEALDQIGRVPLLGALAGPVGRYNQALTKGVATEVELNLNIAMDFEPTQTSSRFRMGQTAMGLVQLVGACEQIATHHRLQAISGVDEFREKFVEGVQKGSSVMPHKRNPIASERICGLARVARGYLGPILETAHTQWWERDLTNSSVEREAFWPLVNLTVFILEQTAQVLASGETNTDWYLTQADLAPEPVSEELIRRVLAGENHETVYREIQERTR